jgi:electron transport complex protein RnfD
VVTLVSVGSCLLFEYLIQRFLLKGKITIGDGSAVITGILLAFNLPSNLPLHWVVLGAFVAIGIGKMTFGGLGKNPFNPALVGRVFLLISRPVEMTNWPLPQAGKLLVSPDMATTGATILSVLKEGVKSGEKVSEITAELPTYAEMLLGLRGGSIGEISIIALLIGALFLLARKVITWHIPVAFLGSAYVLAAILYAVDPEIYIHPILHMLSGGIILGAFFMATDMATSPSTPLGMIIFGVGCGLLTIIIRVFGAYPEGVSFAILLMNAVTPLINKGIKTSKFGR